MNTTVADAIAAELATLERLVDVPAAPLGYGTDLSCALDLTSTMDVVDPTGTLGLAEAIVRRLDCPRGALIDDPDYGIDLVGMLNAPTTATELRALAGAIRAEVTKDDRIDAVEVTVAPSTSGETLVVQLHVTAVDPAVGDFELILALSDAGLLLEEIR